MAHEFVVDNFDQIFCEEPMYSIKIECTKPHENLYKFKGKLIIKKKDYD